MVVNQMEIKYVRNCKNSKKQIIKTTTIKTNGEGNVIQPIL